MTFHLPRHKAAAAGIVAALVAVVALAAYVSIVQPIGNFLRVFTTWL